MQVQDQSRICQAHSPAWKPSGSFRYGSFELKEVSRTGERLARVVDATEGKREEKGRSECEKDYRRYRRKDEGSKENLGTKKKKAGASAGKAGT